MPIGALLLDFNGRSDHDGIPKARTTNPAFVRTRTSGVFRVAAGSCSLFHLGGFLVSFSSREDRLRLLLAGDWENYERHMIPRYLHRLRREPCSYCGTPAPRWGHTRDHIVPRSSGGITSWDNSAPACVTCNGLKGTQSLLEFLSNGVLEIPKPVKVKPVTHKMKIPKFLEWNEV